ncbi:fasciclin-1-like isoform X1 [Centruroides sculpturatus]|uniref:fasciclin-1-like isoform X1 n=2 Tax=Centruroides sculpturatus TaxID=218467 RepID=UPI000C6D2FBB|nr:fasciclin-1-like isoform X1 [Centruroides sculpturatus]
MKCILVLFCLCVVIRCENILDAISKNPNLSKFTNLVRKDNVLVSHLQYKVSTMFAPTNDAIDRARKWSSKNDDKIGSYHTINSLVPKEVFDKTTNPSSMVGGPLFLSVLKTEKDSKVETEYYVNNAKIIEEVSFKDSSTGGTWQILYIIDEMLELYLDNTNTPSLDALKFMEQPNAYDIGESVSMFLSRVKTEKQEGIFRQDGRNTYFIPIDVSESYGSNMERLKKMDLAVIRGHIVPGMALFTRTVGKKAYLSETRTQVLKVQLSIVNQSDPHGDGYILHAESNVVHNHLKQSNMKGLVLSKIIRPNIPVSNGVVHLIETPLLIVDKTIWEFIQRDALLMEFHKLMINAPKFTELLTHTQEKTLFVPSNKALRQLSEEKFEKIRTNSTILTNLLNLHLVMKAISIEDIVSGSIPNEFISSDLNRNLYFKVVEQDETQVLTVEGGGVNATAEIANIRATDGVIHIIDRILGMPFQTVYEKLKNDPSLRTTYEFSQQDSWNEQLHDENMRFTFFAPNEEAWEKLKSEYPSSFKKIQIGIVPLHLKTILNRHLLVGKELSIQHLEMHDEIHMQEGIFKISKGYGYVQVKWEGELAHIMRPGVQATNGVIHVIDQVMMKPRDLSTVSSALAVRQAVALVSTCCLMLLVF